MSAKHAKFNAKVPTLTGIACPTSARNILYFAPMSFCLIAAKAIRGNWRLMIDEREKVFSVSFRDRDNFIFDLDAGFFD